MCHNEPTEHIIYNATGDFHNKWTLSIELLGHNCQYLHFRTLSSFLTDCLVKKPLNSLWQKIDLSWRIYLSMPSRAALRSGNVCAFLPCPYSHNEPFFFRRAFHRGGENYQLRSNCQLYHNAFVSRKCLLAAYLYNFYYNF